MKRQKRSILKVIDERNNMLSANRNLAGDVANFLKNDNLTKRERKVAKMIEKSLKLNEQYLKNLGFSMPNIFVGDLLSIKNYYEYFDSLFYLEKDIITSQKDRTKGHLCLDEIMEECLTRKFDADTWKGLSPIEQTEIETQIFMDVLESKTEGNDYVHNFFELLESAKYELVIDKESFNQLKNDRAFGGK